MKRITAFFTIFVLVFLFPAFGASAENNAELTWGNELESIARQSGKAFPSPITSFHELWNIPWEANPQEFTKRAQELYGISFIQLEEKSIEEIEKKLNEFLALRDLTTTPPITKRTYPTVSIISTSPAIHLFGYPVTITAHFNHFDDSPGLSYIEIKFTGEITTYSQDNALEMTEKIFNVLSFKYSAPLSAYLRYSGSNYAIPMIGNKIDMHTLVETIGQNFNLYAYFGNVRFTSVYQCQVYPLPETYYQLLITIFSPEKKNHPWFLPPEEILPLEEFHAVSEPSPTFPPKSYWPETYVDIGL